MYCVHLGGSILLAAGTDIGSVYVWNIPVVALFELITNDHITGAIETAATTTLHAALLTTIDAEKEVNATLDEINNVSDVKKDLLSQYEHASWIHSLLHTSSNPIYTLSLTTYVHSTGRYVE